ncbi:MAG: ABC transporter permease [Lachnospiraceae bacterium]|nr:ABC transporter permease [Lachnospiraceae bacterium]
MDSKRWALIARLSANDFRKKYAGSYLGRIWALAQPVVTVAMYYVVFDRIFGAVPPITEEGGRVTYVAWLTAGLVPWFFISESLNSGLMALLDYSYLVKKVVFDIDTLPLIKVMGAVYTHLIFVGVYLILFFVTGCKAFPTMIQIVYYSFAAAVLSLALSYFNAAVVVFFRDLQQIVSILLQLLMWGTPILWDVSMVGDGTTGKIAGIITYLNPFAYIVMGYRTASFEGKWFWELGSRNLYFWGLTLFLLFVNRRLFKRLKPHFADVL